MGVCEPVFLEDESWVLWARSFRGFFIRFLRFVLSWGLVSSAHFSAGLDPFSHLVRAAAAARVLGTLYDGLS